MTARSLLLVLALALVSGCGQRSDNGPQIEIVTTLGPIRATLFEADAPITVANFLSYVDAKHYDGTIFHRVIPDFMIQGGGFKPGLKEVLDRNAVGIKNEAYNGHRNDRGTLAMARTKNPDSATDQFFINLKNNDKLDRAGSNDGVGYAVFGKVTSGMEVVDRIAAVRTLNVGGHENVPLVDVVIETIRRVPNAKDAAASK